ncbi:MAG: cyclic nucleotide-binding domain-containing protein [Deltaproteobacteria bacterium]|nr:cyclic nucleotide-binding domain-containing protein [Deltaproteobacteria bacterium]
MAQWIPNHNYSFKHTNDACVQLATSLLESYSLTGGCLRILGKKLQDQLAFGFFDVGSDIILQGESGRDVFMLCSGQIDVLVDNQVVVEMPSPTLVGDKGIVSLNSQRAATIRISGTGPALVIKIPMESFIRDFKNKKIPDVSFSQEQGIFESVFEAVQQRLFEFIYLQKSLWEKVTNMSRQLNEQILAKQLDNQKNPGWGDEVWQVVQNHLKVKYNISWPTNIPINEKTLYAFLRRILDRKYPDTSKPDAITKKTTEWRSILSNISSRVLKSLPDKAKPIPPLELELFNPNIYRMRITGLLNQLQNRYEKKKTEQEEGLKKPAEAFFGKGDRSNEFNLSKYLGYFETYYQLKNSKRLMAQVAQKCALIAAECENSFNASVVKMQNFIEQVKTRNLSLDETTAESEIDPAIVQTWIATLARGIQHFQNTTNTIQGQALGVINFNPKTVPNFNALLKSHKVKFTRDQINQTYNSLVNSLEFQSEYLTTEILHRSFHLCAMDRGDIIPEDEILNNFWFPLSDKVSLNVSGFQLANLKSCMLIGKQFLMGASKEERKASDEKYTISSEKQTLFFVLPPDKIPWFAQKKPEPEVLIDEYLPLMQWFTDKCLEQFSFLVGCRDRVVNEWTEIRNSLIRSNKIELFEKKPLKLPKDDLQRIVSWLNRTLNISLNPSEEILSSQLSKKIYNTFLRSTKTENPELSIEQCGNQAYTKWRNLLYDVVGQIPALNKIVKKVPGRASRPALNILAKQLTPLLSPLMKDTWEKRNPITSGTPSLNLLAVLHPDRHANSFAVIQLFEKIVQVFTSNTEILIQEIKGHKETLSQLYDQQSNADISTTQGSSQVDIIKESSLQLVTTLENLSRS